MMKDIDFDELDRAVNSLMNSAPQNDNDDDVTATSAQNDTDQDTAVMSDSVKPVSAEEVTDEIQLAPPAELMVVEDEPEDVESSETESKPTMVEPQSVQSYPTASLPTVRRGKFMDMVRSPLRETVAPAPSIKPSRQGPTLQPVTSMRPSTPAAKPSFEENISMGGWQVEPSTKKESEEDVPLAPAQPFGSTAPTLAPESGPPVLPFLPDAKVEKRPLGRPVETPAIPETPETPVQESSPLTPVDPLAVAGEMGATDTSPNEDEDAQLPGQPLPAELGSELLSIETGADTVSESPRSMPDIPAQPASSSLHIPGVARGAVATSIPQQYKLQPKEENDDHEPAGAIYDTASYHQPLVHTAKKKPGWLWVVAIIVILLLGAAGGAAVYYFGLKG